MVHMPDDRDQDYPVTTRRGEVGPDRITHALVELAAGRPLVVADDPARENEIDFIAAARGISPATVALMIRHGSGLICAAMPAERGRRLRLPPQVADNE